MTSVLERKGLILGPNGQPVSGSEPPPAMPYHRSGEALIAKASAVPLVLRRMRKYMGKCLSCGRKTRTYQHVGFVLEDQQRRSFVYRLCFHCKEHLGKREMPLATQNERLAEFSQQRLQSALKNTSMAPEASS